MTASLRDNSRASEIPRASSEPQDDLGLPGTRSSAGTAEAETTIQGGKAIPKGDRCESLAGALMLPRTASQGK